MSVGHCIFLILLVTLTGCSNDSTVTATIHCVTRAGVSLYNRNACDDIRDSPIPLNRITSAYCSEVVVRSADLQVRPAGEPEGSHYVALFQSAGFRSGPTCFQVIPQEEHW